MLKKICGIFAITVALALAIPDADAAHRHHGHHHWSGHFGWHHDPFWWAFHIPLGFSFSYYDAPYESRYEYRSIEESPRRVYKSRRLKRAHRVPPPTPRVQSVPEKSPEELMLEHARKRKAAAAETEKEPSEPAEPAPSE